MIPFNVPCSTGEEITCMQQALKSGQLAGNGKYTHLCQSVLQEKFGFNTTFLTPSGTAALEMAALLCGLQLGDEVILPSYTHVSTANAFIRAGAVIKFADSLPEHPNIDVRSVLPLIGAKTKVVVLVHYGGVACDVQKFQQIAKEHQLILVEDAAHAIGAGYQHQWLGTRGDFAAFSFHETKNIHCGQGGMLVVNRHNTNEYAEEIWHHGTNRALFEKGAVPFYTWVRPGGAFLLSELQAAFLYPQLCKIEEINARRMHLWMQYYHALHPLEQGGLFRLPTIPDYAQHNAHIFYLLTASAPLRSDLIAFLKQKKIQATFHYTPLHLSPYALHHLPSSTLPNAEIINSHLVRLPLYDSLPPKAVAEICTAISEWMDKHCT